MITVGAGRRRLDDLLVVLATLGAAALVGATAGHEPLLTVAAVALLGIGVAIVVRPETATALVLALVYSNAVVVAIDFHGLPSIAAAAVPILLLAPVARSVLVEGRPVVATPALPFIVAYLGIELVASLGAADTALAYSEIRVFVLEGVLLYVLLTNAIRTERALVAAVTTVVAVGAALAALSVFQYVTGTLDATYLGFGQVEGTERFARLAGSLGRKNRYAQILLVLVPLALALASREQTRARRSAFLAAAATMLLAIAFTFSRGAAVAAVIVFAAAAALGAVRARHAAAAVAVTLALVLLVPAYRDRLATLSGVTQATATEGEGEIPDGSIRSRATENLAAVLMFRDHPVTGVGPGMYPLHYARYAEDVGIHTKEGLREAHSLYLQVAAESGALGVAAMAGVFIATIRPLLAWRRRWQAVEPAGAALRTGFVLAIVAYLGAALFLHLSYARYLWLLLALAGAAACIHDRASKAAAIP